MIRLETEEDRKAFKVAFEQYVHNMSDDIHSFTLYKHLANNETIDHYPEVAIPSVYEAWEPEFMAKEIEGLYWSIKAQLL